MIKQTITIATRNSQFALWQAKYIAKSIEDNLSNIETKILPISTKGDELTDTPLNKVGTKGLYFKELEHAMAAGDADIAIHSMEDVPTKMSEGYKICCIFKRLDASDAFVANNYSTIEDLPQQATIGVSSYRLQAQLLAIRADLQIKPLHGNIQNRLRKLDNDEFDAIILPTIGLEQQGLNDRIKSKLTPYAWLPAIGQGAIGIECLTKNKNISKLLSKLNDMETFKCIAAERSINKILEAEFSAAIGAYASIKDDVISMHAMVCAPDGSVILRQNDQDTDPQELGTKIAFALFAAGAHELLEAVNK